MIICHDVFIQWRHIAIITNTSYKQQVDASHKPNVDWKKPNSKEYGLYETILNKPKQTENQTVWQNETVVFRGKHLGVKTRKIDNCKSHDNG